MIRVRRTRLRDWCAIEALIKEARYTSPALWRWEAHLEANGFVVAEVERRIEGALWASSDRSPVAWVRLAAVTEKLDTAAWLNASLPPVLDHLGFTGVRQLAWMDYGGWAGPFLEARGFQPHADVITLVKLDRAIPRVDAVPVTLRPPASADFASLAAIDRRAFAPTWWRSAVSMERRARTSSRFTLAQRDSMVIGYAEWELHLPGAHLNRIVVDPGYQGRGIGAFLLKQTLADVWRRGGETVSLNTQRSNRRSVRLYERFGFEVTGDSVTVWVLGL